VYVIVDFDALALIETIMDTIVCIDADAAPNSFLCMPIVVSKPLHLSH
jgi:hypothetical protein